MNEEFEKNNLPNGETDAQPRGQESAPNAGRHAEKHHVPLIHIAKRETLPWQKAWGIRAAAILLSLVFMAVVSIVLTKENPFRLYGYIFQASFKSGSRFFRLLYETAILLAIALALLPAFRMRFWNIGAEGQVLAGAFASVLCMLFIGDKIPSFWLILVMLAAGVAAGALWALIPAVFKAKWGTNETLFTLMMNYVIICIIDASIQALFPKGTGTMGIVNGSSHAGWLPKLGNNYMLSILIIAAVTALMYAYMRYSKHGYEIQVVGESRNTARYIGINVGKVILRTMALSGAICGLTGFLLTSGYNHSVSTNTVGGRGFTAIMVCWLAKFNPVFMILTSLLICFLQRGASEIASRCQINASYGDVLTGMVLFFIIGCEFFIQYEIHFRKKERETAHD